MSLTDEQRQRFDEHGFVVVTGVLTAVDLAPVIDACDEPDAPRAVEILP